MLFELRWIGGIFDLAMLAALIYALRMRVLAMSETQRALANVVLLLTVVYPWAWAVEHAAIAWIKASHSGPLAFVWGQVYWVVELLPLLLAIALGFRLSRNHMRAS